MENKPINPPAFPHECVSYVGRERPVCPVHGGMTLLDYFAAKAMQGLITSPSNSFVGRDGVSNLRILAITAYEIAQAMLKQRESFLKDNA